MKEEVFWLSMVFGILAIVFGGVWSLTHNAGANYYAAQHDCVAKGNSWIPTYGYEALCLRGVPQ